MHIKVECKIEEFLNADLRVNMYKCRSHFFCCLLLIGRIEILNDKGTVHPN
jgi:hypothetical protein